MVQGIGAALLVPQSLALITANFPKDIRGRAIGTWAAASAMTTALGPPIGGFLIDLLSWRVAFWINLPIAAVAVWLTYAHVPESRDETARGAVDWQGALAGDARLRRDHLRPDRHRRNRAARSGRHRPRSSSACC